MNKSYAEIIQRYLKVYKDAYNNPNSFEEKNRGDGNYYFYSSGEWHDDINHWFIYETLLDATMNPYSAPKNVYYRIMDFNKDGTPELFIGQGIIYAAYTFSDGKAVYLTGDGYRGGSCNLNKNGIITDSASSSAFEGRTTFHKISKSKKLIDIYMLGYQQDPDYSTITYTLTKNGKSTKISEKRYSHLLNKFCDPIEVKFYKANKKAIENVKKGKYTYRGQRTCII